MTQDPELIQEIKMLRERLSRLSEASVRINESLDLNVVLQDVIDNARQLTNARYGLISTIAEDGGLDAFLTSGTTEEEHRGLRELPEGRQSFLHYSSLPGTLIVENYSEYAESPGAERTAPDTSMVRIRRSHKTPRHDSRNTLSCPRPGGKAVQP